MIKFSYDYRENWNNKQKKLDLKKRFITNANAILNSEIERKIANEIKKSNEILEEKNSKKIGQKRNMKRIN